MAFSIKKKNQLGSGKYVHDDPQVTGKGQITFGAVYGESWEDAKFSKIFIHNDWSKNFLFFFNLRGN